MWCGDQGFFNQEVRSSQVFPESFTRNHVQIQCFKSFAGGIAQQKHQKKNEFFKSPSKGNATGTSSPNAIVKWHSSVEGPTLAVETERFGLWQSQQVVLFASENPGFVGLPGNQLWNLV